MIDNEKFVRVIDYPDYLISSCGKVVSTRTSGNGKMLKLSVGDHGYYRINLRNDNGPHTFLVHHLVANAFLAPRPSSKHGINHKNGVKTDNRTENLEWCTNFENSQHAIVNDLTQHRTGEEHSQAKLTGAQVLEIRKLYKLGNITQKELAQKFNISATNIFNIVYNYIWKCV